jgi:trans-aconitate methyltransferase
LDITYNTVLTPLILRLLETADLTSVLDLGCGTGQLTASLAERATHVTGIDLSSQSISIAARNTRNCSNVSLENTSLDEFIRSAQARFTLVIANMSLSAIPDLNDVVSKLATLIVPHGHIIATVPHPCFWPDYWGYGTADWFDYWSELPIEAEFRITLESSQLPTTHLHRPLALYLNTFSQYRFVMEAVDEPFAGSTSSLTHSGNFRYPRFLGWRSRLFR